MIDIWSNPNHQSYMAITAHWIAKTKSTSLQLKVALIAFHCLQVDHDGESLATTVIKLSNRAKIMVKV